MEIPRSLLERLEQNEEVAKKFNQIENAILTILNFHDFLEKLLFEIRDKFGIPYTWISIIKESPIADQFRDIDDSRLLRTATAFLPAKEFLSATQYRLTPLLANENLDHYAALLPDMPEWKIGSIAVAPITLDGDMVGSINQADPDPGRFQPGIDTSLLERLAIKVSLCLSNVTAHERLRFLAFHDPLTRLLNRGVMERVLEREFQRAVRYRTDLSVLFLDLDDFKVINDTYGHDVGDQALCHTADCLTQLKRDSDVVARFAGDEFVVILPFTGASQADNYIKRVAALLETSPLPHKGKSIHVRLSHGIASIPASDSDTAKKLLRAADQDLYETKQKKKNKNRGRQLSHSRQ